MVGLSEKDKRGLALIVGLVVFLLVIGGVALKLGGGPKPGEDNCINPVTNKTVVLIDRSDAVSDQTTTEIVNRVQAFVRDKTAVNELVSVFEVSDISTRSLKPLFSACKPKATGNRLIENTRRIAKRFAERFEKPLREALRRTGAVSSSSPISEAVIDLSLSEYMRGDRVNLLVFSDLMQNSRNATLYGCTTSRAAIEEFRRQRSGAQERPEFRNTAVTLHVIPREGLGESVVECRTGFWAWFFGNNAGDGAGLDTSYLPGGAALK